MYYPEEEKFKKLSKKANLIPVYRVILADMETPVSAFMKLGEGEFSYLLESVEKGKILGRYRRTTPYGPWIYKGGPFWDFNYQVGNELPIFETDYCKIGILICSEVFVPELSRILALKGAEIIFIPNGLARTEMWETWTTLIKARAFENNAVCATCRNILGIEGGMEIIAGPEETLVESRKSGVHLANIDLDRIRWLRANRDEYHKVLPYKSKPGLLTQWRRPDLYGKLIK